MFSPYLGKFKVTQEFKGELHDGLDLVGIEDKNIYSTVNGVVDRACWENPLNHKQGFGQYVRIKEDNSSDYYYFGHLFKINVSLGQRVSVGDVLGYEGNTGYSTGSHCHYCVRQYANKNLFKDISVISGIPNKIGIYHNELKYYLVKKSWKNVIAYRTCFISQARLVAKKYKYNIYDEKGTLISSYR